jgi:adenine-specific DNA-methyltransferase
LGAFESGVFFEKRIVGIYQCCRTPEDIRASFDQLQEELSAQINEAMTQTRQQLLENFDVEVHEKLRVNMRDSEAYLNRYEQMLMDLTRHELGEHASFEDGSAFMLLSNPFVNSATSIPLGRYELPRRSGEAHYYRLGHPLAMQVLEKAMKRELAAVELLFDYANYATRISGLEALAGKSGTLSVSLFSVESLDQTEDHIILAAVTDDGLTLDEEQAGRLLTVPASIIGRVETTAAEQALHGIVERQRTTILKDVSERNASFFEAETNKIDGWADDLKVGLEREIKEIDRQIKETRRAAVAALTLEEKLGFQKNIRTLESQRNSKRRALFDAQDEIDKKRDELISEIEGKLQRKESIQNLFCIHWRMN